MGTAIKMWTAIVLLQFVVFAAGTDPQFDPTTRMRLVLVPADAAVGSVIYRLRATDAEFDYPLTFELSGKLGPTICCPVFFTFFFLAGLSAKYSRFFSVILIM